MVRVRHSRALMGASLSLVAALSLSLPASAQSAPPEEKPAEPPYTFHASLADGVGVKAAGNKFGLDIGILTQMRADMNFNGGKLTEAGFNVLMVRPTLRLKAFQDKLRLFVQPELGTATPRLLDYELTYQPAPEIGIRVGQFLTPFSRAFLTPVPILQFNDFSRVNTKFRADRDTGAMVFGATGKGKLEYYLGAFNGNGLNKNGNDDTSIMGIGRIAVNPVRAMPYDETPSLKGDVPFGIAIAVNGIADRAHPMKAQTDPTTGTTSLVAGAPETRLTGGGDIAIAAGGFTFLGEAYVKQTTPDGAKPSRGYGMYAQAGYFVVPKHFEIAARVGYMDPNTSKDKDTETSVDGLLNGYIVGNHLKLGLRYQYVHLDAAPAASGTPTPGLGTDGLKAGANHRVMAQMQLWL